MSPELVALLGQIENAVRSAPREDLPAVAGRLEELRLRAELRARAPMVGETGPARRAEELDRLVRAEEAAKVLGISISKLEHRRDWPFRIVIPPGAVRYSVAGIQRYIRERVGAPVTVER